uniref:NADH-ubiquinone oxidoreductase chain 4L n=1 Tax=Glyptonotus cf. antarcticus FK-2009 TaxID=692432 RepID=E3SX94_9CRUS|nr:NADH dehydrogenase subunit 4L [Glyptonotus cf. antarcticus FK-2009]
MSPWAVFMLMFTMGFISFVSNWNHILSTLIALGLMALALFFAFACMSYSTSLEMYFSLFYLALAVCEGALGLSILISSVRSKGNDMLSSKNLLKW